MCGAASEGVFWTFSNPAALIQATLSCVVGHESDSNLLEVSSARADVPPADKSQPHADPDHVEHSKMSHPGLIFHFKSVLQDLAVKKHPNFPSLPHPH